MKFLTKTEINYFPELDEGEHIVDEAWLSASMWLPKHRIKNKKALINSAMIETQNSRTGEVIDICLAKEFEHHIVLPKYLHRDWEAYLGFDYDTLEHQGIPKKFRKSLRVAKIINTLYWEIML